MSIDKIMAPLRQNALAFGVTLDAMPELVEILPVAVYACDAEGRVLWFNSRAAELWGRRPCVGNEKYTGAYRVFVDGEERPPARTLMAQTLRTQAPIRAAETQLERPDGSRVWITTNLEPVKDDDGRLLGAISCFYESTERHEATEALRDSEHRLHELLAAIPAAIYTTDAEGTLTYYNEAAVALAGRRPTIGVDKWSITYKMYSPDGTLVPPDQTPMAMALKEGRPIRGKEAVAERPDGTRVPLIPFPTPLRDANGKMVGAINMLIDISERRQAETQQRLLLRELNHRVKNNMQMLQALLHAARGKTSSEEARRVLDEAAGRISAMAAAQRVLYGADAGVRFDAQKFLDAVCETARQTFPSDIRIVCEAALGGLNNDNAMPLALILNELLTNAVKYGCAGSSEKIIRVGLMKNAADYSLYVEDGGPGFDLETVAPQASGLKLVQLLARQLRGRLEVTRIPNSRCSVYFDEPV